jgi:hypothetical protein
MTPLRLGIKDHLSVKMNSSHAIKTKISVVIIEALITEVQEISPTGGATPQETIPMRTNKLAFSARSKVTGRKNVGRELLCTNCAWTPTTRTSGQRSK